MSNPTTWRPLTQGEIDRGVTLHLFGSKPSFRVACANEAHHYWVPLHHQPDLDRETWTGVCGSCQRWYRLRLEVGDDCP